MSDEDAEIHYCLVESTQGTSRVSKPQTVNFQRWKEIRSDIDYAWHGTGRQEQKSFSSFCSHAPYPMNIACRSEKIAAGRELRTSNARDHVKEHADAHHINGTPLRELRLTRQPVDLLRAMREIHQLSPSRARVRDHAELRLQGLMRNPQNKTRLFGCHDP